MKKLVSVFVALVIASLAVVSAGAASASNYPLSASPFTVDDYPGLVFQNDWDDHYVLSGYTGSAPVLTIPETIYNNSVIRIYDEALYENNVIESLIMNDGITNVKEWSVRNCPNLSYVYYSKSLKVLGKYAFGYNKNLTSALLRNTIVKEIGSGAYMECQKLEYLALPDTLETIDGTVFNNTSIRKVVIPDGVKLINARSFANCSALEKVYIPSSVKTIGTKVFDKSNNLTVYTPEGSEMQTYCENNGIKYELLSQDKFPSRLLGDVNGDGELTINDVTFIQRELVGYKTDFYPDNCDFNGDCKLDINDATEIQYKLVGLD